jgi:hypothetical protein
VSYETVSYLLHLESIWHSEGCLRQHFFSFECWSNISSLWKIQFISYKKNGKNWQKKILVVITLSVQKGSQSFFNFTAVLFLIIFQSIRSFSLIFAVNYIPSLYAVCVFSSSLYLLFSGLNRVKWREVINMRTWMKSLSALVYYV